MNQPISNPYRPFFYFNCCRCGGQGRSHTGATGPEPFTWLCWQCLDGATRDLVDAAAWEEWAVLSDEEKRQARLRLYGVSETQQIEARERKRLTSW